MKKLIKEALSKLGIEIVYNNKRHQQKVISLRHENTYKGNVLLAYIIEPFLLKPGEPVSTAHTCGGESLQIAKIFLDLGYSVDVIDKLNSKFVPKKKYSFYIGSRTYFQRFAQLLNEDCVKIVHLDTAHWLFNNFASYKRSLDLQQRRMVTVRSQRILAANLAIEYADYATILGNQFTISTYRYAQKPIYRIPISTCAIYPWPVSKNYETCRRNFLWFGSHGLVHKGLDLVLDAFANMPEYHLYICGPIQKEKDFESTYYKELYETSNIHTKGWVDVSGHEFVEITNNCIGLIYPSCSEGGGGSVINCLHAGLIPIVSYESSVDVGNDFGVILKDCSVDEIRSSVRTISAFSAQKLEAMSRKAWEFARANHTRERFAEEYKKVILHIIQMKSK